MPRLIRTIQTIGAAAGLVAAVGAFLGCQSKPRSIDRVLVFGIDGGSWNVIGEMFEAGELPNLKKLYDSGVHGVLESRPPVISPVVWSTIFTGRPWQEHGVKDWKTSQSSHRKVKTVWDIATSRSLKTYALNVPSTWPPQQINGAMVSGFPLSGSTVGGNTGEVISANGFDRADLPPIYKFNAEGIRARMKLLAIGDWSGWFPINVRGRPNWRALIRVMRIEEDRYYLTPVYRVDEQMVMTHPASLHAELDGAIGEPYIPEGPGWSKHAEEDTPKYLSEHLLQVSRIQTRAAELLVARPWDLFIYVDTLVDRVSHPYWAYMRPDDYDGLDREKAARYADVVRNAYRETDLQLGRVLEQASGDFWVVIVSDHGFQSSQNRQQFIGTHHFDGIYLISAPGLPATAGARAYIEDTAPTVLYLLEEPVADDMAGRVLPEIVELLGRPIQRLASYEDSEQRGSDVPVDERTWEQLRGLGYVDGAPPRRDRKADDEQP